MSRQFGERVPQLENGPAPTVVPRQKSIFPWIAKNEIGRDAVIDTPFGKRQVLYCDYSASARAVGPIEDYIREEVLPLYGNTHSSVTVTAEQTTLFVHEARQEVRAMTGAGDGDDVIFTGTGTTAAVELLVHLMKPEDLVVIHSIHEHHSNLLPWRAVAKQCYCVKEDESGRIDIVDLERVLRTARDSHPTSRLLAAFTGCSNVTGIVMDVSAITAIVKRFDCISVWDMASAAPYVDINVNGSCPIDALFFSGHKFIGGVATPGVLVVKKSLIANNLPQRIGGGTVFFVNESGEWFLKEAEYREEGGTPDAVGSIRLALAIKLKRSSGPGEIMQRERQIISRAITGFARCPNVVLLGPSTTVHRVPVLSFLIRDSSGLFFHHNYVSALLNDLFGIQSRAGCMCAGPYAQHLLGINETLSSSFLSALREPDGLDRHHLRRVGEYSQREMLRPGFSRLSIPYFFTDDQIDFIIECVRFVSERATDFIHLYQLNCDSAEWHHHKQRTFHGRKWLGHVQFSSEGLRVDRGGREKEAAANGQFVPFVDSLEEAERLADEALLSRNKVVVPDGRLAVDASFSSLRWFVLPIEVVERERNGKREQTTREGQTAGGSPTLPPFTPRVYAECPTSGELDAEQSSSSSVSSAPLDICEMTSSLNLNDNGESVFEEEKETENGQERPEMKVPEEDCEPCSVAPSSTGEAVECPLDPADRGKGRMGDMGTDEVPEEAKEMEDWNRRVIVMRRELSRQEEAFLPWHDPPLEMYKRVTEAIHGMNMIKDGDRVLVCLSGGKDSLAMLHILHFYQMRCRKNKSTSFELGAITVDPGSSAYNPRPLIEYCRSLNIDYFYEEQDIIGAARKLDGLRSICAFCSRMKRGRLAAAAQLHGWNVLAMGQHLDDLAESFFIAAFQNGNLSTMKAQYNTRDGALRVIRPLVFVRERALREFSESNRLPVIAENCPACFSQATERHRIKQLLAQQELVFPDLFHSLRAALRPLLLVDSASTDQMRALAIENIVKHNKGKAK